METQLSSRFNKEIRQVCKHLDAKTELELILKAQAGCINSRNTLINSQLSQIKCIATCYITKNNSNCMGDLISVGVLGHSANDGFVKAINDFDPTRGIRLITFASRYIQNAIRDYSLDNHTVRNSRQHAKSRPNDEKLIAQYTHEADLCGMSLDEYVAHKSKVDGIKLSFRSNAQRFATTSFDTPLNNSDGSSTLSDIIGDDSIDLDEFNRKDVINKILNQFDVDDLPMIKACFGLDRDPMSMDEIGKDLSINGSSKPVTRQTISRKYIKAMDSIKIRAKVFADLIQA